MQKGQYIRRKLEDTILKYLNSPEIIAVVGARQSGKTTLLSHIFEIIKGGQNGNFISFEDRRILNMFEADIDGFVEIYVKNKKYLFIDEFQYAKDGGKKLKYIFDLHKIKIFISGSSAIDLTVNALKFLVGRIFVFELYPLDFEEFLNYKDRKYLSIVDNFKKNLKESTPVKIGQAVHDKLLEYYEEYALYGGYPRVVIADSFDEKKEVLKNIYNTYFLREVRDILGLVDDYKLSKLIKSLALQIGNMVEYKELSIASEYSYPTLKIYMNFLEKTFICGFIRPYFKNKRIEIVKNPKVYFFDTGLRNIIVGDFRNFDDRPDAGQLLENAVFQQLVKSGNKINYWRSKKQHEVDFVVSLKDGGETAIEVKKYFDGGKFVSMAHFKKIYPQIRGIFVYANKRDNLPKDILYYPIYAI